MTCGEDRCLVPKCIATAHVSHRAQPARLKCETAGRPPPRRQAWTSETARRYLKYRK